MSFPYLDREAWYIFKVYFTQVYSSDIETFFHCLVEKKKIFYKNQCLHSENDYMVVRELETELCL